MNYLAHAYLSFGNQEILAGNIISDFVKGKKKFEYPQGIQKGITLHRMIDAYTDAHAATHEAKAVFKPAVGLYAGVFIDVVYDHFLAIDENYFSAESLLSFTQNTYASLDNFTNIFPEKFARMFPYMKAQNWMYNYQFTWGIEKSFGGIVRRATYLNSSEKAFEIFIKEYDFLKECSQSFLSDVKDFAEKVLFNLPNI